MLVTGHRGASGYRPENTLAAHELALRLGADRVECDVVPTADGVLVLRHESDVSRSTDVASRRDLAHLRRRQRGPGAGRDACWSTEDMSVEQVAGLRAVEPRPSLRQATTVYDGVFGVPTLAQLLALVARLRVELGRAVNVAIEVKDPARYAAIGLDVAAMLLDELAASPLADVVVQCFDPRFLADPRVRETGLPLVQLVSPGERGAGAPGWPTPAAMCGDAGLDHVASYAAVLAPRKDMVLPVGRDGSWGAPTDLVGRAHARGTAVHVFTAANENARLPPALRVGTDPGAHGRAMGEYLALAAAGVDGVFTDHPDTAVEAARLATLAASAVPVAA